METAEIWIKPRENKRDGQNDLKHIQAHYGSKGKKYVRIKETEVPRNTLYYKNKRDIYFEKFLTNMKYMFTGFEGNDEILTEAHKIQLISQKSQRTSSTQVNNALQVSNDLDQEKSVTFDFISKIMAAEASDLPEMSLTSKKVEWTPRVGGGHAPDGAIFTGFYNNFQKLYNDDKQDIFDTRKRLNIQRKIFSKHKNASLTKSEEKEKILDQMYREIYYLKVKLNEREDRND